MHKINDTIIDPLTGSTLADALKQEKVEHPTPEEMYFLMDAIEEDIRDAVGFGSYDPTPDPDVVKDSPAVDEWVISQDSPRLGASAPNNWTDEPLLVITDANGARLEIDYTGQLRNYDDALDFNEASKIFWECIAQNMSSQELLGRIQDVYGQLLDARQEIDTLKSRLETVDQLGDIRITTTIDPEALAKIDDVDNFYLFNGTNWVDSNKLPDYFAPDTEPDVELDVELDLTCDEEIKLKPQNGFDRAMKIVE